MSTTDEPSDLDPVDEQLVAYLDGELEQAERAQVERRLAQDEEFRDRLRTLQRSWDALDLLPRSSAGDAFTSTTVGLIAAQQQELATQAVRLVSARRSQRWVALVLAGVVAATVGFALVFRQLSDDDRALVRDLPVIEQVDELTYTPSVAFLEKLAKEGLFLAEAHEK